MKTSFPSWLKASKNEALVQLRQASFRQFLHSWTDVSAILTADYLIQCGFFKMLTIFFLINHASDRNSEGTLCSSTFSGLYCEKISAQNSNVYVQENFFLFLKRWFFGVVFWIMRLFQSQILRPSPWWKKLKPHVTVLSIIKVFFPVLIFQNYKFSKFWKILALNRKKINFGILKNKVD